MFGQRFIKITLYLFTVFLFASSTPLLAVEIYKSGVSLEHSNGVVVKIMHTFANRLQIKLQMQYAPFARRLSWLKSGELDIMGGLLKRKDREEYIHFVMPPYVEGARKIFFVRKGEENQIQQYEDLYDLKIGTKFHSKYFSRFDKDEKLNKQPVPTLEQNFKKLMANRIDTVVYSYRSGYTTLMKMGLTDNIVPASYFYSGNPVFIGISKNSPLIEHKGQIESVVKQMVESGEIATIITNHYKYLKRD